MVPGGSDGSGAGNGRMGFPSRRKQFLGFVALSEWLLEQLGNGSLDGVGSVPTATTSSSDAPTTVCVNILRGCQVSYWVRRLVRAVVEEHCSNSRSFWCAFVGIFYINTIVQDAGRKAAGV